MAQFEIEGGRPLVGRIKSSANKNAIVPIMAATLLTDEECVLENVPKIGEVLYMGEIMQRLGCQIEGLGTDQLRISTSNVHKWHLDLDLVKKVRASVLFMGPLLARLGKIKMSHPGGDIIGRRSIDTHLEALASLGVNIKQSADEYDLSVGKISGKRIFLDEVSVTATENIIMAAVLADGTTIIEHAACEPSIVDLCYFLVKMGAKITGIGSNVLVIEGVSRLRGITHSIIPDYVDAATFAIAAAITKGNVTIDNVVPENFKMIKIYLEKMGLKLEFKDNSLTAKTGKLTAIRKVDADPWPGFPTDLISPMIVLATQAQGMTLIHDWMFESRLFFTDKLIKMGASIVLCDPHRCVVSGPTQLYGKELESPDIRAGMALVLAALCAEGKSVIHNIEHIERGYEDIVGRLESLGAKIKRIE